jgi:hypothetical protein
MIAVLSSSNNKTLCAFSCTHLLVLFEQRRKVAYMFESLFMSPFAIDENCAMSFFSSSLPFTNYGYQMRMSSKVFEDNAS